MKLNNEQIDILKSNYLSVLKLLMNLQSGEMDFRSAHIAGQVKAYRDIFNVLLLKGGA